MHKIPVLVASAWAAIAIGGLAALQSSALPREAVAAAEQYDVVFTTTGLEPVTITVPVSATVRWVNATGVAHSTVHKVPSGPGGEKPLWASPSIPPDGGEFSFVFSTAGVFPYYDPLFAGDDRYEGYVVVQAELDPGATAQPTPTTNPTTTSTSAPTRTPTEEPTPTARPSPAPVVLTGRLLAADPGDACSPDAVLRRCPTGEEVRVRSDIGIGDFLGRDVRIEGTMRECSAGQGNYVELNNIQGLPGGCGTPPVPPTPTATRPAQNIALSPRRIERSDELAGRRAANAVDGDPSTVWTARGSYAWMWLDLGAYRTFNEIVLRWSTPRALRYAFYVFEYGDWNGIYQTLVDSDGGVDEISLPRIYARYVLLYLISSSDGAGGFSLSEWEIYGRETANLARGGAVEVSSARPGRPGTLAIDGSYDTSWASLPVSEDPQPWLRLFLPRTALAEVRLCWSDTAYPRVLTFVFQRADMEDIPGTFLTGEPCPQILSLQIPIPTDALLVYAQSVSPARYVALSEVELYDLGAVQAGMRWFGDRLWPDWTARPTGGSPIGLLPLTRPYAPELAVGRGSLTESAPLSAGSARHLPQPGGVNRLPAAVAAAASPIYPALPAGLTEPRGAVEGGPK